MRAVMFAGARIGGIMTFAPFFNSESISMPVKASLTVALAALLYPAYALQGFRDNSSNLLLQTGGEVVVGLLLGLSLQFVFDAAHLGGYILGVQTGFSLVTLLDPQSQADTPALALFNQLIVTVIFLQLNVHHWLLRGLAASFNYLPPGRIGSAMPSGLGVVQAAGGIWLVGLQIAAPVLVATLVADVALGFLGRASPQLPVLFLGLSVKSMLGLSLLIGVLASWPHFFEHRFSSGIALGERLLHLAR
jgi:flagellar biosynthetic protein FliR